MVMSSLSACEKATPEKSCWDLGKNNELYWFQGWGENYVDINEQGNIIITPDRSGPAFDLHELVQSLVQRGIEPPILLRFDGIIRDRIRRLCSAFAAAIQEFEYKNQYHPVLKSSSASYRGLSET